MRRRRRHDAADGDPAIGGIDVQLVPDPGGGMALALRLAPTSQALGSSASICGRLIVSCRSSRIGSIACSSHLRGRPRLRRRFGFAAFSFGAAFSRASIAVASREMCSTRWPSIVRAISVSCRRLARRLSANSEKAFENVASLGSRPAPLQQHSRHSMPSTSRRSIRPRVVGTSNTALAYEGARQRRTVLLRPPYLAAEVRAEEPRPARVPATATNSS